MRSIKTTGLATAVALALIAVLGASSASASLFLTPNAGETTVNGAFTGAKHVFKFEGGAISCNESSFSGQTVGTQASKLKVSPQFGACPWVGGFIVPWAMNGCKFRFNANGTGVPGTVDIVNCKSPMSIDVGLCRREIGNQPNVGSVEYVNKEAGGVAYIAIVAKLSGITYTGSGCSGTGTFHNGEFIGEWTAKGTKSGFSTPLSFESSTLGAPTVFAAEEAPVTISGQHVKANTVRMSIGGGWSLNCDTYSLSGSSATVVAEAITLTPQYKTCNVGGGATPDNFVSMGGCKYVFHVNGKFDIAGATCASNPILITSYGCVTEIGPQSGLSGTVSYSNQTSGEYRTVSVSGKAEGVSGTKYGPLCFASSYSNGTVVATTTLSATNSGGEGQAFALE